MPLARDVMQTHLVTVEPELPLVDVHRLFVEEEITGAPVVDDTGRLLGVISSTDLLRAVDGPLTVGRFLSNIWNAPSYTRLHVPRDPRVAEREFCRGS